MRSKRHYVRRRRMIRRVAACFILFHVAAVIIAPASVDPTSPMWLAGWDVVQPYTQTVFLDQGWNYFSPEPGASTTVSYRALLPDGEVLEERMPDKRKMWPRLLYHRHFMLTSYMGYQPEEFQIELCEGYIDHIKYKHGATEVAFSKWDHLLPSRQHILEGGNLGHYELWIEYPLVEDDEEEGSNETALADDAADERAAESGDETDDDERPSKHFDELRATPRAVEDNAVPTEEIPTTAA